MAELDCCFLTINCSSTEVHSSYLSSCLSELLDGHNARPQIIFVALEEIASIPESLIGGKQIAPHLGKIHAAINAAAHKSGIAPYELVQTCVMNWVAGLLFALPEVTHNIRDVQTAFTRVGVQAFGNKAAVAIRFNYRGPNDLTAGLTFVGAHLMHGEQEWRQRNKDWRTINENLIFGTLNSEGAISKVSSLQSESEREPLLSPVHRKAVMNSNADGIFADGSYLFFGGDLNYRTSDTSPNANQVKSYPQAFDAPSNPNHWSHLLDNDQLRREKDARHTLHNLHEAQITYPPTYKYTAAAKSIASENARRMTTTLSLSDVEPSQWLWAPHRWPSWCDRILYSRPSSKAFWPRVKAYTSLPVQPTSDHQPVALLFSVPLTNSKTDVEWPRSPFEITGPKGLSSHRSIMRAAEVVIGIEAWFVLTWQGRALVLSAALSLWTLWSVWNPGL